VLRIQTDLDWNEHHDSLSFNFEDGAVFFYRYIVSAYFSTLSNCDFLAKFSEFFVFRDNREKPKQLNADEVMEIAFKENSRLTPLSTTSSYSPRRERALKIYLDTEWSSIEREHVSPKNKLLNKQVHEHKTFVHKMFACWIFVKSKFHQMPSVLCSSESSIFHSLSVPTDFRLFFGTIGFLKLFGFKNHYIIIHNSGSWLSYLISKLLEFT